MKFRNFNRDAVSQVISTLLTIMIVIGAVASILVWGLPYIEDRKMRSQTQTAINNLENFYSSLSNIIVSGPGTSGESNIIVQNEQTNFQIDSEGDKQILLYSYNNSYDFYTTGLGDNDDSFKINMDTGDLDKVNVYWLDPTVTPETPSYLLEEPESIYKEGTDERIAAQSFKITNNWNLDRLEILISKIGTDIGDDLMVSIYSGDSSGPNIPAGLQGSFIVYEDNISSTQEWIECDFETNIALIADVDYFIVLNTTEGVNETWSNSFNYYQWYYYENSVLLYSYDNGERWYNKNNAWTKYSDYDFARKLYFVENTPPETPVVTFLNGDSVYSGISEDLSFSSNDLESDQIRYICDLGDGQFNETALSDSFMTHTWIEDGEYHLTIQARDEYGNINEIDLLSDIIVKHGIPTPEDTYASKGYSVSEGSLGLDGSIADNTVTFDGSLRIDLFDIDDGDGGYDPPDVTLDPGTLPFARIYVFDLGYIKLQTLYGAKVQDVIFENGAIISTGSIQNSFKKQPSIFEGDTSLSFGIIQIQCPTSLTAGGEGSFVLNLDMINSYNREPDYPSVENLKIQMYGEYSDNWLTFLKRNYKFSNAGVDNTVKYDTSDINLVLNTFIVEIELKGLR